MFLIKQVSSDLGITPQAIYKQKEELQNKGYMIKNSSNDWEITSDGYNYLKEKQINRFKRNNISLKENDIKSIISDFFLIFLGISIFLSLANNFISLIVGTLTHLLYVN